MIELLTHPEKIKKYSRVRVMKKKTNEIWQEIHTGWLVGGTTSFGKVYSPLPESGDSNIWSAQLYPYNSNRIKIVRFG